MSEPPGRIGPYQILERLGAGGMGEVFLAHDERLDRKVAIKRIRLEKNSDPDRRERFRREARIAARLNQPAIVALQSGRSAPSERSEAPAAQTRERPSGR